MREVTIGRVLAIEVGGRRVGLAISDRSRTLARPLETILVSGEADAVDRVARRVGELAAGEDARAESVVARPSRLDGTASSATPSVVRFINRLTARIGVPIVTEDER